MKRLIFFRLLSAVFLSLVLFQGKAWGQNHCLKISSADKVDEVWDSQFFIKLSEPLPAGTNYSFSIDIKADEGTGKLSTMEHGEIGKLKHWSFVGSPTFSTEWNTYMYEGEIYSNDVQTIQFSLNEYPDANTYYFDNMSFIVNGKELIVNGDCEGDNFSNYFYSYDRGSNQQVTNAIESDALAVTSLDLTNVSNEIGYSEKLYGTFTALFSDGTSKEISIENALTTFDKYTLGTQEITVKYRGYSATMTVTVSKFSKKILVYEEDFTKYTEFPFNVMGYTPQFDAENGLISKYPDGWYQYYAADNIPTEIGKKYTIELEIKGEGEGSFKANMNWGWGDGENSTTTVSFTDKWETKTFDFADPVGKEACRIIFQPGSLKTTFYVRNLKVYAEGNESYLDLSGISETQTQYEGLISTGKLKVEYRNGSSKNIDISDAIVSIDFQKIGEQIITVSYYDTETGKIIEGKKKITLNKTTKQPYGIFDETTGTVTFYFGEVLPEGAVEVNPVRNYYPLVSDVVKDYDIVNKVIFDKSFHDFRPTTMAHWFRACKYAIEGLENINTEDVTDMSQMFIWYYVNKSVYSILDLSSWDTRKVTNMESMFYSCAPVQIIYVGDKWSTESVTNGKDMFNSMPILVGGQGTTLRDIENLVRQETDDNKYVQYARIDGGPDAPGLFTQKGENINAPFKVLAEKTEYVRGESLDDSWTRVTIEGKESTFNVGLWQLTPNYNGVAVISGFDNTKLGKQTITIKCYDTELPLEVTVIDKDTVYSIYNSEDKSMTVYYGAYKDGVATIGSNPHAGEAEKIIIDKSFANYKPTSLSRFLVDYEKVTEIVDLDKYLNTENVTDMSDMFMRCHNLKTLDLSSFNTKNVTNMSYMFDCCSNLTTIYVGDNWKTDAVTNSGDMFGSCQKLVGGKGTMYDDNNPKDATYARIDGGKSAPGYFTKAPVKIVSITLTSSPTKLEYIEGQELDITGGEITITYNDETTETIDLTDANVTLSEFDNTKTGDQTIKVFLKDEEVGTFTVNVKAKSVVSIAVTAPKNLEVIEGTDLDLTGGKITISYNNGTTEDVALTDENVKLSEFDNTKLEEQTITVTYKEEFSDEFKVTVVAKSVSSISVTKKPEKLTYKKGETLTVDDGEITVTYNNKTTEVLAFTAEGVTISEFYNTTLGDQSIKVTYAEKVATFNITVVPDKEISKIEVSKLPKTEYFAGEDLNISDGELTITYDDQTTETVKLSIAKLSGFNSETVGKQTIKVTYLEKETTFEVNVKAVEIVSIELTTAPTKLEYIENEEFSAEGGEITVTFNNEATQKVALTDEKVSISGFDNTKVGTQTLKVVYNEKETTFDVKVIAKSLEKIAILTQPAKVEYLEGEEFSAEGGEFVAYYNNNSSDTLELGKATVSGFDNTKIGEQVLKVVYNEKTAEIKVTVNAKPEPEPEPEPVVENPYTKPELKDGFYQISTAEELLWFVFDVNSGDTKANAALTQDIVFNEDCLERVLKLLGISKSDGDLTVWQPIGTLSNAFAGIFDGQGHSISGLFINDKTQDNVGLFGATTSDAVIKNVAVVDSYISGGENVGAICGKSEGKIENCYSLSEVKGTENVNGIAGKVESGSTVENCYYLAETPKENDPCAKTAAEFKSGEVAELLAKGGEAWKDVKELPGVESVVVPDEPEQPENPENPETATFDIVVTDNVKIWSFEKTIYVENSANEIVIVDLTGRVVKNVAPDSNRMEIQLSKGGIFIVKTGLSTKKVSVK